MLKDMLLAGIIAPIFNDQRLESIVYPFAIAGLPDELVDQEKQEDGEDGKGVESEGGEEEPAVFPVEDEVFNVSDCEGFNQEYYGGGQLHENEQVHQLYVWRRRNRAVDRWQKGHKSKDKHCDCRKSCSEPLFLEENTEPNHPENPYRYKDCKNAESWVFVNRDSKVRVLIRPYSLLIMLFYFLFLNLLILILNLIRIFPRIRIGSLEPNRTDAIVPKREIIAVLDASGFGIVEAVKFDVVLDIVDTEVDCLADDEKIHVEDMKRREEDVSVQLYYEVLPQCEVYNVLFPVSLEGALFAHLQLYRFLVVKFQQDAAAFLSAQKLLQDRSWQAVMIEREQQSALYCRFHPLDIHLIQLLEEKPYVAGKIVGNLCLRKLLSYYLLLVDLYLHIRGIIAPGSI